MQGLDIRSRPRPPDRTTQRQLADVGAYAHWVWPTLPHPLTIEWRDSLVLALDGDVPWIFGPAECDPLRSPSDGTVIPRRARAQLKRIAALGVPFQRVAIAHELSPDGPVRDLIPALRTEPRACSEQLARRLVGDVPAHPWVVRAVRTLDAAVNAATGAARTPADLVSKVLDPIIFGIVSPTPVRHGDLCLWYPLAAWRW
jgi:hypothetical protein